MGRIRIDLPEDLRRLLDLIHKGKLFAVQSSIQAGKSFRFCGINGFEAHALHEAVRIGFHSMIEVLLGTRVWTGGELNEALELAGSHGRSDIADLLVQFGAQGEETDFATACEKLDLTAMEKHLRAGIDPHQGNAFAEALSRIKAKPLLGFYRNLRSEFPALDDQAALALCDAVNNRNVRWAALLVWAGADPLRSVPSDLSGGFPVDQEDCTTAAREAIWRGNDDILKVLHLKPNAAQALELLSTAGYRKNMSLFRRFVAVIPREKINDTNRGSSAALEELVRRWPDHDILTREPTGKGGPENLECVELLLDAGAHWNPPANELRYARRALLKHDARYIVQLLRLLLYTPNAANILSLLEVSRSQSLLAKIGEADLPLLQELKLLRTQHPVNTSNREATTEPASADVDAAPK